MDNTEQHAANANTITTRFPSKPDRSANMRRTRARLRRAGQIFDLIDDLIAPLLARTIAESLQAEDQNT